MAPNITGIHHIALKAKGLDAFNKTIDFYHGILGLPIVRTWGEGENIGIMLSTGDGMLEIFANAGNEPGQGPLRHMAFAVTDTDACVAAVRAAGYEIIREPVDIVIGSVPPYPARIAFCIGPVGEEIEFFQAK